jgi:hypothetical protein
VAERWLNILVAQESRSGVDEATFLRRPRLETKRELSVLVQPLVKPSHGLGSVAAPNTTIHRKAPQLVS